MFLNLVYFSFSCLTGLTGQLFHVVQAASRDVHGGGWFGSNEDCRILLFSCWFLYLVAWVVSFWSMLDLQAWCLEILWRWHICSLLWPDFVVQRMGWSGVWNSPDDPQLFRGSSRWTTGSAAMTLPNRPRRSRRRKRWDTPDSCTGVAKYGTILQTHISVCDSFNTSLFGERMSSCFMFQMSPKVANNQRTLKSKKFVICAWRLRPSWRLWSHLVHWPRSESSGRLQCNMSCSDQSYYVLQVGVFGVALVEPILGNWCWHKDTSKSRTFCRVFELIWCLHEEIWLGVPNNSDGCRSLVVRKTAMILGIAILLSQLRTGKSAGIPLCTSIVYVFIYIYTVYIYIYTYVYIYICTYICI